MEKYKLGLCFCGCGLKTKLSDRTNKRLGTRLGIPNKFIQGHQRKIYNENSYFVNKNGCWIWKGKKHRGYASIYKDYRTIRAHRYFYEKYKGPIPQGLTVDHLCRNRGCVNPIHLEAVTSKENNLRGIGIAAINSKKTHCKNNHEFTKENTYIRPTGGRACKVCAKLRSKRLMDDCAQACKI